MGLTEGFAHLVRHFIGSVLVACILILVFLGDRIHTILIIDSPYFWYAFTILSGTGTIGSLIIGGFVNLPGESHYRGIGQFIRSFFLGIFLSLMLILIFLNDTITIGAFMFFDMNFWTVMIAGTLLTVVGKVFMNQIFEIE
jgi:hypothetical protein